MDYRAVLNIKSLNKDGEVFDFSEYVYKPSHIIRSEFEKMIKDNVNQIADEACFNEGVDSVDLISVTSLEFEEIDCGDEE